VRDTEGDGDLHLRQAQQQRRVGVRQGLRREGAAHGQRVRIGVGEGDDTDAGHGHVRFQAEAAKGARADDAQPDRSLFSRRQRAGLGGTHGHQNTVHELAKDDERLPETLVGLHVVAVVCLLLHRTVPLLHVHRTL
jgi:hypothetical protein